MSLCGSEILKSELERGAKPEVWVRFPRQLGDVIFSLPFFGSLRREWNGVASSLGVKLRWVAVGHAIGAAVFSEAHPDFIAESVIESGGKGKPDPWHLLRRWREDRPVAVINLSQSVRLALAAWMARVPIRAGDVNNHLGMLYHYRFTYRDLPSHVAERFRPLLQQLTGRGDLRWEPLVPETFGGWKGQDKLVAAGWDGRPYITLAFGTRGYSKRWFPEVEKWPELARIFLDQGFGVVWLGGPDEVPLGHDLAARAPGSLDLTGQTTIPEAGAIQHGAYGNVAVDTGLAHTAAGSGRPTVTLIGASSEPLIAPQGPYAVSLRGSVVDVGGHSCSGDTGGSASYRVSPLRVANVLHAVVAEAHQMAVSPVISPLGDRCE